jgi:RND family efflux transporter MFP subunit
MNHRHALPAVLLFLAACTSSSAAPPAAAPPPVPVGVETLKQSPVLETTEYIGTLRSRRSIAVQPQVDGYITRIFVKSGDRVEPGRPLIQIDPARQRANLTAARASHASRRAALSLAERELARTRQLVDHDALPHNQLDQALSTADALRSEVAALDANIRSDEVELGYYRITAPAGGVVGDIPIRVGDHVTPATLLTTLDDNAALEAYVSIPVEEARRIELGLEVQLVADGDVLSTGKVHFISPQVSNETQSILIKTDVDNRSGALRPEQFVRARVIWGAQDGLTVPPASVVRMNGQTFVFVAESQKGQLAARMRPVALGELIANRFAVRSGLEPGEKVVSSGVQKIRDGAPIALAAEEKRENSQDKQRL